MEPVGRRQGGRPLQSRGGTDESGPSRVRPRHVHRGVEQAGDHLFPDRRIRQVARRLRRGDQAQSAALGGAGRIRTDLYAARPAGAGPRLLPARPRRQSQSPERRPHDSAAQAAHDREAPRHHLTQGGSPVPLTTEQIEALKRITSPSVANAIEVFKVRPRQEGNVSSEIRGLFPELGPLVGYAATCLVRAEQGPIDGHRASLYGWWDFVMSIPAPRVIVVHDIDEPRGQGAQWGEVQANIHRALGCAGVVTDGSVRDLDEVRALGFQFAAAHISVSHAYVHMVDFGLPIKVGGLWVMPGDLIHADQHGAVTIPAEIAPRIPEAVVKVEADERKIISLCKSPTFSADGLKQLYKQIRPGTY